MQFSQSYAERLVLDDGTVLMLRAIRPSDKPALAAGFERLSVQSRRQRFLSSKTELTEDELRHLTECDGINDYAIVAVPLAGEQDPEQIVGVARLSRLLAGSPAAEIAIAVVDDWQRRGIGRQLLRRIVNAASERGITQVDGIALADNQQLRALIKPYAQDVRKYHEDGLSRFSFDIPTPEHPDRLEDLYALLRLVAQGAILMPLRFGRAPLLQLLSARNRRNGKHRRRPLKEDVRP